MRLRGVAALAGRSAAKPVSIAVSDAGKIVPACATGLRRSGCPGGGPARSGNTLPSRLTRRGGGAVRSADCGLSSGPEGAVPRPRSLAASSVGTGAACGDFSAAGARVSGAGVAGTRGADAWVVVAGAAFAAVAAGLVAPGRPGADRSSADGRVSGVRRGDSPVLAGGTAGRRVSVGRLASGGRVSRERVSLPVGSGRRRLPDSGRVSDLAARCRVGVFDPRRVFSWCSLRSAGRAGVSAAPVGRCRRLVRRGSVGAAVRFGAALVAVTSGALA